jgi:hypothetical protein
MSWFRRRSQAAGVHATPPAPVVPRDSAGWRLAAWDRPDLMYAKTAAAARHHDWRLYVPNLELVRCGDLVKPALFFKIGRFEFADWSTSVEPRETVFRWYQTKGDTPYVVLELCVLFENTNGAQIGVGGTGQVTYTTEAAVQHAHRLRCSTMFDPANPAHREAIHAYATAPSPSMMFFVEEDLRATSYVSVDNRPEDRAVALEQLVEAERVLRDNPANVPGGFTQACTFVRDAIPPVSWWY